MKPGLGVRACTRAGSCQPRRTDHYEHFFCSGDGGWWLRSPARTRMGRGPQHAAATSCKRTGPNAVYDWRQRPRSPRDLYPTGAKVRSSDAHETFQPIRRAHRHVCGRYPRAVHHAIVAPGRARAANCHAFEGLDGCSRCQSILSGKEWSEGECALRAAVPKRKMVLGPV